MSHSTTGFQLIADFVTADTARRVATTMRRTHNMDKRQIRQVGSALFVLRAVHRRTKFDLDNFATDLLDRMVHGLPWRFMLRPKGWQ